MSETLKILVICNLLAVPAIAATELRQQDITEDTHWTENGSPYIVYGDITVRNGAVLTIDAGVEVRFAKVSGDGGYEDGAELVVRNGTLISNGSQGFPVIFTAHTSNPSAGYWGGIVIELDNQFVLEHTNVRYAKKGLRLVGFSPYGASNSSTDYLEISDCSVAGIYIDGGSADIYHCTVRDNDGAGVKTNGFCESVNVHFSDIYDNGLYNFDNRSSNDVNSTDCWWGTTVKSLIEMRIYDEHDNPTVGEVDYEPYLSGSFKDVGSTPQYSWGTIKTFFSPDRGGNPQ